MKHQTTSTTSKRVATCLFGLLLSGLTTHAFGQANALDTKLVGIVGAPVVDETLELPPLSFIDGGGGGSPQVISRPREHGGDFSALRAVHVRDSVLFDRFPAEPQEDEQVDEVDPGHGSGRDVDRRRNVEKALMDRRVAHDPIRRLLERSQGLPDAFAELSHLPLHELLKLAVLHARFHRRRRVQTSRSARPNCRPQHESRRRTRLEEWA